MTKLISSILLLKLEEPLFQCTILKLGVLILPFTCNVRLLLAFALHWIYSKLQYKVSSQGGTNNKALLCIYGDLEKELLLRGGANN